MNIEYRIIYRIGAATQSKVSSSMINLPPRVMATWIGDKLQASINKLQKEINAKNLHGTHTLELRYPEGWEPQAPSNKQLD
jgi:hypothetical protein